jgi:hypothetical protein
LLSKSVNSDAEKSYARTMLSFDYAAPAELFMAQARSGLQYRRFARAAEALKYAIEELPANALAATALEVNDERYGAEQIRALYESERFPLTRKEPSS